MITVEQLEIAVGDTNAEHEVELTAILAVAIELVDEYVGASDVPLAIMDICYLRVAMHLYEQSNTQTGSSASFYETNEAPSFLSRDPLNSVYKLVGRWVAPW